MTTQAQTLGAGNRETDGSVRMYPNNQLKEQKRDFSDTKSAFSIVKDEFFNK